MKRIYQLTSTVALLAALPFMASAQTFYSNVTGTGSFGQLLANIIGFINSILIPFIIGIGFLFFVWGMFLYFIAGGANDESKEKGRSLMVYATLGFVLIIIFWGVVNLLATSTGFAGQSAGTGVTGGLPEAYVPGGGTAGGGAGAVVPGAGAGGGATSG